MRASSGSSTAPGGSSTASPDVEILLADELAEAVAASDPRGDLTRSIAIPVVADRPRARAGAWYEMVPRSQGTVPGQHGTFDDCIARLPDIAALGFDVVYLTPIHPIGMTNRKGKNNSLKAGARRSGQPLRDRELAGRPRRGASRARHARRLPPLRRRLPRPRHGGGARLRHPMLAGSSLAEAASGMVQAPSRRLDQIRREPAEEIRGHRQSGFLLRRPHRAVAGAARRHPVLGAAGRPHLPRRQSAHQAVPVLGMADPRGAGARPERAVPVGGVFAAEDHEGARQARLLAVLQLFHLAHAQGRTAGVSQRDHALSRARLLPAEFLRQHARHPAGASAEGRAVDVQVARGAGGDAVVELRHLQRLRAPRARADSRPRGVSQLRQIRDQGPRLGQAGQHQGLTSAASTGCGARTRPCCRPAICVSRRSTTAR